jgi:hypothetical protein
MSDQAFKMNVLNITQYYAFTDLKLPHRGLDRVVSVRFISPKGERDFAQDLSPPAATPENHLLTYVLGYLFCLWLVVYWLF